METATRLRWSYGEARQARLSVTGQVMTAGTKRKRRQRFGKRREWHVCKAKKQARLSVTGEESRSERVRQ
ncbi:hypothetical protein EPN96_12830 [bacterium]|nr:MAG: hypothetical protein EPN96_12830 [bacterium]